jgi:hypothetical protein
MNILLLAMMLAMTAPQPAAELHTCPAPRTIILVQCPGPHEITTQRMSCKQTNRIDECGART